VGSVALGGACLREDVCLDKLTHGALVSAVAVGEVRRVVLLGEPERLAVGDGA
jgi:hypothetical protein